MYNTQFMKKNSYLKKIFVTITILSLMFLFSACQTSNGPQEQSTDLPPSDKETSSTESYLDSSVDNQTEPSIDDLSENENYKQLTTRDVEDFGYISFLAEKNQKILCLKVPSDWLVEQNNSSSYTVKRAGITIGNLFLGEASDLNEWVSVTSTHTNTKGFDMTEHIEKYGSDDTLKFRYRYCANNGTLNITLTVDYTELNSKAAAYILKQSTLESRKDILDLGIASEAENGSILIIGNSFINTSNIGNILTEMMRKNNKNTQVTAISRGMATVETYVSDSSLMSAIERGTYDVVFVCGLYTTQEILNIEQLKKTCDVSDTKLVIFPAHNESPKAVTRAEQRFPSIEILDWRGEIDALIGDGRDIWEFCIDDTYRHSTPMAGYVGAHMIYRAIHGELPTARLSSSIRQPQVNSVLQEYVRTGYSKSALYTLK